MGPPNISKLAETTPFNVCRIDGRHLAVTPQNVDGGFFTDPGPDDAYYGVIGPGADVITIGYGSDNPSSVCFGPQIPGQSRCVVTGVFEQVPEPASVVLFATAIVILTSFGRRRQRVGRGGAQPAA